MSEKSVADCKPGAKRRNHPKQTARRKERVKAKAAPYAVAQSASLEAVQAVDLQPVHERLAV